jgi:hypothetical protein
LPPRLSREFFARDFSLYKRALRARTEPSWRIVSAPDLLGLAEGSKVNKPSAGPIALIVDDDLGFVWWLGERFHEAGYCPVPALSPTQAGSLVRELDLKLTVLVVNPGLRGVQRLMKTLSQTQSRLVKIILILDPAVPPLVAVRGHAIVERPSGLEPASRHEWLRKLRRILGHTDEAVSIKKITGHPPPKH